MSEQENVYYVYLHRRGDNNEVFYVGKGKNGRAKNKTGRNCWWINIVNKYGYTIEIVEKSLSEPSAFELEIELIKFYRECGHTLCNLSSGGEGGSGCIRSAEHKEAIGRSVRGVPKPDEVKIKMAQQGREVYCSNGMMFVSARRAALWVRENTRYKKAHYDTILDVCKGVRQYAFGYEWSYYNNLQKLNNP